MWAGSTSGGRLVWGNSMKRSLLAYNGFGTIIAIVLWYALAQIGIEPIIVFVGAVAGLLLCASLVEEPTSWFWMLLVLLIVAIVSYGAAHAITEANALHMFLVCGTLFLTVPISAQVLGTYKLHSEQMLPGTPAFLAFAWFVNLGVWWGVGAAFFMFSFQLGLAYWLLLQEKKLVNVLPA